jgi:uncharacterized peroxidase-related enzyme
MNGSFLGPVEVTPPVQAAYDADLAGDGFVWNLSKLWAYQPETKQHLSDLMSAAFTPSGLDLRQRGILVTAAASTLGDSYCSIAWGEKLSGFADAGVAAAVLTSTDDGLSEQEQAMAAWARKVVHDPNAIEAADVQELRGAGLTDEQIFAITVFIALRLAFSTINDALGAQPDRQLVDRLPPEVAAAVSYGRPPSA